MSGNLILLLDLIQAGVKINQSLQDAFRQADAEGRNVTHAELTAAADASDDAFDTFKQTFNP